MASQLKARGLPKISEDILWQGRPTGTDTTWCSGDIVRTLFSCPSLTSFWQKVMDRISNNVGSLIIINPRLCFLHNTKNIKDVQAKHFKLIKVDVTTAKRVTLRHCKEASCPVINNGATQQPHECIIYKISHNLGETWGPFLMHCRETQQTSV